FTPKNGIVFPKIMQSGSGGTTISGNNLKVDSLLVLNGTFNLGAGRTDSIGMMIDGQAGGTLHFGTSNLQVGMSSISFGSIGSIIPGSGEMQFTGDMQTFTPLAAGNPKLKKLGSANNLSISGEHLRSPKLVIANGGVIFDSTFNIDTIEVQSGASVNFGGMGPTAYNDTVKSIIGNGELNLGYYKTVVTGNIDLSPFSNVFGMSSAGFIFAAPSSVSYTHKDGLLLEYLEQKGPGTLNISGNGFNVNELALTGGTLNLSSSLNDTINHMLTTAPGANLNINNATLAIGASFIDFGVLGSLTSAASGKLAFTGSIPQGFVPKGGATHPNIYINNIGGLACSINALNGNNIYLQSGTLTLAGNALTHSVDTISGSSIIYFEGAKLAVKGNADFTSMIGLSAVDASDTIIFNGTTGVQQFSPLSATNHPVIIHNGNSTLKLNATALQTYGFKNSAGGLDFSAQNISTVGGGDFSIINGTPSTISNLGNSTISVSGAAHFSGQPGNLLNLDPVSNWNISTTNGLTADYATIANNTATGSTGNPSVNCVNGGSNTGWDWNKPTVTIVNPTNG
ncbi:MAG: hypothetical protein JNL74_14890, partial [Fibrobacteres bacterium]|nr:hypothetical protein [Fibrobacterota bacterium]